MTEAGHPSTAGGAGRSSSQWAGEFGVVFFAKGAAAAISFFTMALVGRALGPDQFGDLILLRTLFTVAAGLVGPALDTAMVHHIARDMAQGLAYHRVVLKAKLLLAALMVLVGCTCAGLIRDRFFVQTEAPPVSAWLISLALLGAAGMLFLEYARASFQARQLFQRYALFEVLVAGLRFVAVLILLACGAMQLAPIFGTYAAVPLLLMVAAFFLLPRGILSGSSAPGTARTLYRFARWVVAACLFTNLAQGLDMMILGWLGVEAEAKGLYGAARTLMLMGDLLVLTFFTVLLPKASSRKSAADMHDLITKHTKPVTLAALAVAPCLLITGPVMRLTFGSEYAGGGRLLAILLVGTAFSLASAPAGTAIYGLGRSHWVAILEGIKLFALLVTGFWAASKFGVEGMAWTAAAIKGTMGVVTYAVARREIGVMCARDRGTN